MRERILADPVARRLDRMDLGETWLIGGTIRDYLFDLVPRRDFDLLTTDYERLASLLADFTGHPGVVVSPEFRTMIFPLRDGGRIDLVGMNGRHLLDDLSLRDCTINAIALPWGSRMAGKPPVWVEGTERDVSERLVRNARPDDSFGWDPVRALRVYRMAALIGGRVEEATLAATTRYAPLIWEKTKPERLFEEVMKLLALPQVAPYVVQMDERRVLTQVFPLLEELRGCEQNRYHHQDVLGHTLESLTHLEERVPEMVAKQGFEPEVRELLTGALKGCLAGYPARAVLRLALLLHDVGKPATREEQPDGRITFHRHDQVGAELAAGFLEKLRTSGEVREAVVSLVRYHLRPGFLANRLEEITPRAFYRLVRDVGELVPHLLILNLADFLATQGPQRRPEDLSRHLEITRRVASFYLSYQKQEEERLITGEEVMELLGIGPGPEVGDLLEAVREAQAAGEISTPEEARNFILRRVGKAG